MYARGEYTIYTNQRETVKSTYKERGDWLLPVPLTEALRLPYSQERATIIDPTSIYTHILHIHHPISFEDRLATWRYRYIPMGIYRCIALMTVIEISQVSVSQEQSVE